MDIGVLVLTSRCTGYTLPLGRFAVIFLGFG